MARDQDFSYGIYYGLEVLQTEAFKAAVGELPPEVGDTWRSAHAELTLVRPYDFVVAGIITDDKEKVDDVTKEINEEFAQLPDMTIDIPLGQRQLQNFGNFMGLIVPPDDRVVRAHRKVSGIVHRAFKQSLTTSRDEAGYSVLVTGLRAPGAREAAPASHGFPLESIVLTGGEARRNKVVGTPPKRIYDAKQVVEPLGP